MLEREALRDHAAHRVAEQVEAVEAERVGEAAQVVGELREVIGAAIAAIRFALAALVDGDGATELRERRELRRRSPRGSR